MSLCNACAEAKGWKCFKTGHTVMMGVCPGCNRKTWLTPEVDFVKDPEQIKRYEKRMRRRHD